MILGVIPARGGSKGILRKNIKEVCGKPLIAWTIEVAKQSKLLDRFVVSTEDDEIAKISKNLGAEVLPRPSALAADDISTLDVLQHILKEIESDIVVILQPTSPIRNPNLIDKCIKQFLDKDADSLTTGFICKYKEYGTSSLRRQDINGFFYDDGNIYVIKANLIHKGDRFGKRIERFETSREENIEIDDDFDLWLAERILEKRSNR